MNSQNKILMSLIAFGLLLMMPLSSAWVGNYSNRIAMNSSYSGSPLTNLSLQYTFPYQDGMNQNFSDVYITNSTDGKIPFWFYNNTVDNGVSATVYVRFPYNYSDDTLYIYYNDSHAPSYSNITTAFLLGEDWNSGIDYSKWQSTQHVLFSSADGYMYFSTDPTLVQGLYSMSQYSNAVMVARSVINLNGLNAQILFPSALNTNNGNQEGALTGGADWYIRLSGDNVGSAGTSGETVITEFRLPSTGNANFSVRREDGTILASHIDVPFSRAGYVSFSTSDVPSSNDWVFVKTYTTVDPSTVFGSPESAPLVSPLMNSTPSNWTSAGCELSADNDILTSTTGSGGSYCAVGYYFPDGVNDTNFTMYFMGDNGIELYFDCSANNNTVDAGNGYFHFVGASDNKTISADGTQMNISEGIPAECWNATTKMAYFQLGETQNFEGNWQLYDTFFQNGEPSPTPSPTVTPSGMSETNQGIQTLLSSAGIGIGLFLTGILLPLGFFILIMAVVVSIIYFMTSIAKGIASRFKR